MSSTDVDAPEAGGSNLRAAYIRVLALEAIVLVALYWFGRHFA